MNDKTSVGYFTQGKITITLHFLELIPRKYEKFRQIVNTQPNKISTFRVL